MATPRDTQAPSTTDEGISCWVCSVVSPPGIRGVWRGLATLGIEYPGPVRMICDDCVAKIKEA